MFVDVIYIFVDNVRGLNTLYNILSKWVRVRSISSLPLAIRLRVIIIVSNIAYSVTYDILNETDFFFKLNSAYLDLL
jgi:hypothetical protein